MSKKRPSGAGAGTAATASPGEPELPLAGPEASPLTAPGPNIDTVVALLRNSDLGEANRRIAADFPETTIEQRLVLLRAATQRIWEAWLASDARLARERLARRCGAIGTIDPG